MPLFRYHCSECNADFELLLARYDSSAECPHCGSEQLEKFPSLIGSISSNNAGGCSMQSVCPAAGGHCCSGGCGCGKH